VSIFGLPGSGNSQDAAVLLSAAADDRNVKVWLAAFLQGLLELGWGAAIASGIGQFAAIQGAAPPFGVELRPVSVRDAGEIERDITEFARGSNGGLIVGLISPWL
jgi:hypothetical protein